MAYPVTLLVALRVALRVALLVSDISVFRCKRASLPDACHAEANTSLIDVVNMPRDMSGTGRYPPVPLHQPTEFYGAVRLGDPERLFHVMSVDPYFITQDNGAGAPIHFATTYKQLDMVHHLLNNGADVNQRDDKGLTPLHRAAHLAQYDGYTEIYEYLLVGGGIALRVTCALACKYQPNVYIAAG